MGLIFLGVLPSFGWLVFYLSEDALHPEPRKLIIETFVAGAISTVFVLQAQIWLDGWSQQYFAVYSFPVLILFASAEEILKFAAAYLVMGGRKELDEPVDAMIYPIVAALGFAAVENVASILKASGGLAGVGPLETVTLRFVGATLLHTLTSGLIGYYWGRAMVQRSHHFSTIFLAIVAATLLHALFNHLILNWESIAIPMTFLIVVSFFILNDFEKLKRINSNMVK